jgi:2-polyprenyl-6-methoxyphenol hydroxylase-like FAD-dependent oxidoreductase
MSDRHAVVIGASMGGLLAARVVAESHERVTVVDRDELPPIGAQRKGVPQGRHAHGLLARGRTALEELFPGLTDELVARGALTGDIQESGRWSNEGRTLCQAPSGLTGLLVSRPLLEGYIRTRLRSQAGVQIEERCSVAGLLTSADGTSVTGVRLADGGGTEREVSADLVVDATGRTSKLPAWLEALGYPAPEQEAVHVGIGYATRQYTRRPDHLNGDVAVITAPAPPSVRAGVVLAVEDDRWVVTLAGYGDDLPPTDAAGWEAYAHTLPTSDVAEVITSGEPLDDPVPFRYPASVRRRYERLDRFPAGLLAFGDSICSFNPIYGQGMTVASLEALALRDALRSGPSGLAPRFFAQAGRLVDVPWEIAVGTDLRFSHVDGRRTAKVRLVNRYLSRVHVASAVDPVVGTAFLRVVNLIDRPEKLLAPPVAARVLRANLLRASLQRRRSPAVAPAGGAPAPAATTGGV